jgi:hypothetical protein
MTMVFAMLIQPLLGVVVWGLAFVVACWLLKFIPQGRIRRFLTRPIGYMSADPRRDLKKDW